MGHNFLEIFEGDSKFSLCGFEFLDPNHSVLMCYKLFVHLKCCDSNRTTKLTKFGTPWLCIELISDF